MTKNLWAALLVSAPVAASAQPVPGSPTGLLIDQGRIEQLPSAPTPTPATVVQEHLTTVDKGANDRGIPIRGVRFDGTQVPERVGEAAEPFIGRPASTEVLNALATAMSAAYGKTAVALYTVAIPAQTFSGGIVHVRVAEGFIEHVAITGDVSHNSVRLVRRYAMLLAAEKPLRRATLQRYLSLIRDIPGLTLDVQLLRGDRPGGVKLVLILKQKGHDFSISFDNRTQQQLAEGEFQATGKLYGALRPGDETDLSVATSPNFRDYGYVGLTHSTPIGANGARASVSIAHLSTRERDSGIEGDANIVSFTLSQPLIRSYTRNLVLSASLDGVNSDNAVLGSLLSRERTRAVRGSAGFSDAAGRHSVSASLTVSHGLDVLGADTDVTLSDPEFTKLNGRVSIDRAIGKRLVARVAWSGQWSDDPLPAVERFIVGGADFGRAFPVAVLAADRGMAGSAELAWRPLSSALLGKTEIYVFGDGADVRYVARGPFLAASYDLASAGVGVRLALRDKARLDLEAAKRIDRPYPGYPDRWQINVAWRLSLGR